MAGIRTDLRDWAVHDGGWELPVTLQRASVVHLETALGRSLTSTEISSIEKNLAHIQFMRKGFHEATSQSVRRTLAAISKMPPDGAVTAYRKSDSDTEARIDEAMHLGLGIKAGSPEWVHPSGENVSKAAAVALANYEGGKNGPPFKWHHPHLASYAVSLWETLGGSDWSAWAWDSDDPATPLVEFMLTLAWVVDDEAMNTTSAARLIRKQIAKTAR